MASYKSTENLLSSDHSLESEATVKPVKPLRQRVTTNNSIESRLGPDLEAAPQNHQIHQVQPMARTSIVNKRHSFNADHNMTDGSPASGPNRQIVHVQTAADVHRSAEPNPSEQRVAPIPMPRRKLVAADSSSGTKTAISYFAHVRQNTIVEKDENLARKATADQAYGVYVHPTNSVTNTIASEVIDELSSQSSDSESKPIKESGLSPGNSNNALGQIDADDQDSIGSNSDATTDSEEFTTSVHTINEKDNQPQRVPPPKPSRKVRDAGAVAENIKNCQYDYDNMIGIYIHETSRLKFDYALTAPMVRVSIYDVVAGELLRKSDATRSAIQHSEPDNVHFIQPLVTRASSFKESTFIECVWEELLLINEDINHVQTGNEIIFFEIVTMMHMGANDFFSIAATDGWHHICWAFLRPGDGRTYSHIDKRNQLQLYVYQSNGFRKRRKFNILEQWRMKRQQYPATLSVTVKTFKPIASDVLPQKRRPMHVLEEDTQFDLIESSRSSLETDDTQSAKLLDLEVDSFNYLLGRGRKLPGQSCQTPNQVIAKLHQNQTKGSLVAKFNTNGSRLAVAIVPVDRYGQHDIVLVRVPGFRTETILQGHSSIVYSLDWGDATADDHSHLLSVSSDRTGIIWRIDHKTQSVTLKILPHPCYVYAGIFMNEINPVKHVLSVVTGGRDGQLRLWKSTVKMETDLMQELDGHDNYISSIVRRKDSYQFYSADWNGTIIEWNRLSNNLFEKSRIVKSFHCSIRQLHLQRNEETLFVTSTSALVASLNIRSGIQLHSFDSNAQNQQISCVLSPCGSLLFTSSEDHIQGWNILSGKLSSSYKLPLHASTDQRNYISSLDYHPHTFMLSVTIYGETADAGVYILDHEPDSPVPQTRIPVSTAKTKPIALIASQDAKPHKPQDLSQIIQRIDDIFRLPQNRTDDIKSGSNTRSANTYVVDQPAMEADSAIEMKLFHKPLIVPRSSSLTRSGTYTVPNDKRTFSISNGMEQRKSGTFDIVGSRAGYDSDDTTISETL